MAKCWCTINLCTLTVQCYLCFFRMTSWRNFRSTVFDCSIIALFSATNSWIKRMKHVEQTKMIWEWQDLYRPIYEQRFKCPKWQESQRYFPNNWGMSLTTVRLLQTMSVYYYYIAYHWLMNIALCHHFQKSNMWSLLVVVLCISQSMADITRTNPATGACLCASGTAVNVRSTGERNIICIIYFRKITFLTFSIG